MRKTTLMLMACLFVSIMSTAQKKFNVYAVGFYNQENLFDTVHNEGKRDYDFLPNGIYKWDKLRYTHKLRNMSRALADMGTDVLPGVGCSLIGVSEVEDSMALADLVAQEPLKARNFQFVHIEGPDSRGIDCALLYNPSLFTPTWSHLYQYKDEVKGDTAFHTRGYLTVKGILGGDSVCVIVCHWPSRFNTSPYRETAGRQVKKIKDSLLQANPDLKVFVMGDMNDDPMNASMKVGLAAKGDISEVGPNDMYNPFYDILAKQGTGTLMYNGSWNLFDQIVLSPTLLDKDGKKDFSTLKYWKKQIFRRDYLFQQTGKYKGAPLRTTAGGVWLDGFSDHLPVVVYLVKEQK
ncbi:endonuclease/exonuclease/phosphatase family protein [Prevotella sp. S7 MS 2]|uniref:endonuclease/exonuclease/phosphatase family protein n=1 Tax=Prevotella sp. S7 MS 2 TaxID=1287488 RepID=UPI000512F0A3|nr:endonuclease/exonuclease/phosphatase family protein [Prevotella sp. S7 MS 2]KGI60806.1 endonuclease [Prevotella sp. S7 MS 2]